MSLAEGEERSLILHMQTPGGIPLRRDSRTNRSDMLHITLSVRPPLWGKTFSTRPQFFSHFSFLLPAMGNTSWATKHKIVLSILCGLNKVKIIMQK